MRSLLLDYVVRDRESIQSLFVIFFGWIRFQPRDVRRCNRSLLDSNREGIENTAFSEVFRITQITLHCPFHESSLSNCHKWVVDVILLQIGLKSLSMRMTLDLLHELANAEVVCLFHNCMWQSRHSEVNVYFLELREQTDWLSTHRSSRSCERIVLGKGAKVLIRKSAQGSCPPHGRRMWRTSEWKGRWERRWRAKSRRESRWEYQDNHIMSAWGWDEMKCAPHTLFLSQCPCDIKMWAVKHEKMWRLRCAVHTSRRLQQIAVSCKRSDYNKFFKKNVKVSLWAA